MKLLAEVFKRVLVEGRKEDILAKYPQYADAVEAISNGDPSGSNKYLAWAMKWYDEAEKAGMRHVTPKDIIEVLGQFHSRLPTLKKKDINLYSFDELIGILQMGGNSKRAERKFKKGASEKIFENERWLIVHPKNSAAACFYGKGTKWCTSAAKDNAFDSYASENVFLFYIIDKTSKDLSPFAKIAVAFEASPTEDEETGETGVTVDEVGEWFDASDTSMSAAGAKSLFGLKQFHYFVDLMRDFAEQEGKTDAAILLDKPFSWTEEMIRSMWPGFQKNSEFQRLASLNKNTPDDILMALLHKNPSNLGPISTRPHISDQLMSDIAHEMSQNSKLWKCVDWRSINAKLLSIAVAAGRVRAEKLRAENSKDEYEITDTQGRIEGYDNQLTRLMNNMNRKV